MMSQPEMTNYNLQSVSFVPSSRPEEDADAIVRLTAGRFITIIEQQQRNEDANANNKGSITLMERINISSHGGTNADETQATSGAQAIVLLRVDDQHSRSQQQVQIVPNATLILTRAELSSLQPNGDDGYAVTASSANWALVRLDGGGSVLLATSPQDLCTYGHATESLWTDIDIDVERERQSEKSHHHAQLIDQDQPFDAPPYQFPSLDMSVVLSDTDVIPGFTINSRKGVPIESDLFIGKVLLMMRPPNSAEDDPYYHQHIFSKKKRRFEIQIQGKFKYIPKGTVWVGFEVTEQMQLGLVSKGLCNLLLRLVSKTVPGEMHYSFGDKNNDELPHISFPAWTLFDKVVVTKEGEEPPPLGPDVLPESKKASAARKRSGYSGDWNTTDTYSFSYHSMYLDLPIWHLCNLPTSDIDLSQFWGESLLRIVVYENGSDNGKHLQRDNRYIAGIQAQYLGFEDDESIVDMIEENDAKPIDQNRISLISHSISYNNLEPEGAETEASADGDVSRVITVPASALDQWDSSTVDSDDETTFYDATGMLGSESELALGGRVYVEDESASGFETNYVSEPSAQNHLLYDMLCPAWIDVPSEQRGKYTRVFVFVLGNSPQDVVFRSAEEFSQLFSVSEAKIWVEGTCSPRLSVFEKQRRIMGYTLAVFKHVPTARSTQRCLALRNQEGCQFDGGNEFLCRPPPVDWKSRSRGDIVLAGCYVARALSERHWVEEYAIITSENCSFYHPDSKRSSYQIHITSILGVNKLKRSECPYFPSFHFLSIETVSRIIYLMFRSDTECRRAKEALLKAKEALSLETLRKIDTFDDQMLGYLHKSSVYSCKQRRLLNNRKFAFTSLGKIGFDDREGPDNIHPLTLMQNVLTKALQIHVDGTDDTVLDDFLDSAADLKNANLSGLSEKDKCAFYLNLYHAMVLHGQLVFGPPTSGFGSNSFVNHFAMTAYEVGDEIFSITELEHNIIRATMSR